MTIARPIWKLEDLFDAVTAPKPHRTGAGSRWPRCTPPEARWNPIDMSRLCFLAEMRHPSR